MKLEVYDAAKAEQEPVRIALEKCPDGVFVKAVARDGAIVSVLARFGHDGRVEMLPWVDPRLGFVLDTNGRIKVSGKK